MAQTIAIGSSQRGPLFGPRFPSWWLFTPAAEALQMG